MTFLGKKHTKSWKKKMGRMRKGKYFKDSVKIGGLHNRMRMKIPKPKLCQDCNEKPPYDLSNISGKYKEEISDWKWLCRGCHMRKDGRMNNLKNQKKAIRIDFCIECGAELPSPKLENNQLITICNKCGATYTE